MELHSTELPKLLSFSIGVGKLPSVMWEMCFCKLGKCLKRGRCALIPRVKIKFEASNDTLKGVMIVTDPKFSVILLTELL